MEAANNIQIPSKEFDEEWIWASDRYGPISRDSNAYSGKWMIFPSLQKLDDGLTILDHLWIRIDAETSQNKFYKASARTAVGTFLSNPEFGVICVHTTDYRNEADVILTGIKIQLILNSMNIRLFKPLAYKTYNETLQGQFPGPNLYEVEYSGRIMTFHKHFGVDLTKIDPSLLPIAWGPDLPSESFIPTETALQNIMRS